MNKTFYPAETRGDSNIGWLHGRHSFSIGPFHDPNRMAFGALRVLNDDTVQPGKGFGTHGHANVEIISIPASGAISHQDSTGREETINVGDVQIMSAGTGIRHSEYNLSKESKLQFLQIWIAPNQTNVEPRYQQIKLVPVDNGLQQIVSPEKSDDGLWLYQDAWLHKGRYSENRKIIYEIKKEKNGLYVFMLGGKITIDNQGLSDRDALAIQNEHLIEIYVEEFAEFLLIDVPLS